MAAYRFRTVWSFDAPIDTVWEALSNVDEQGWWPGTTATQLARGDRRGIGAVVRYEMRTSLPYALTFVAIVTRMERPHVIEVQVGGELVGTGRWDLVQEGRTTHATYLWEVRTTARWMNLLAPLLRPAFVWNHHQVMQAGARGLARHLGVRLTTVTSGSVARRR